MILRAEGIQKRFDRHVVLREAAIEIGPGSITLLLGTNGSGKTTLANILATLLSPDRGAVTLDGKPIEKARGAARRVIGFASHRPLLYIGLTPLENLAFFGGLAGVAAPERRAMELLERLGMAPFARAPVDRFSRGMLQRIVLARALLTDPKILLLDEPYTGLDETGVAVVNDVLRDARDRGTGSLVITHEPERVRPLATRVLRMQGGRVEAAA
ncbi:MAG TPA: ABC transporter ATP-binding protein [Candidatus Eisenbacteria bacterium]|nr:ABC transporter ATP-binding protein [Candidatus Eisenbacteria bacterium]